MKIGTAVALSNGETVYVAAHLADVRALFRHGNGAFVQLGKQTVNPACVCRVYAGELAGKGEPEELAQPL